MAAGCATVNEAAAGVGALRAAPACVTAARLASVRFGLPEGLLAAIGTVESGRVRAVSGVAAGVGVGAVRAAWPYTVDSDGSGHWFAREADAAAFVRAALAGGARAIDVGCFQIDLQQHPGAFTDLRRAFDPVANADYAAGFLTRLRLRRGSWLEAIAAYHSANPSLGIPYARLVTAAWTGDRSTSRAGAADPHVIRIGSVRGPLPLIVTP